MYVIVRADLTIAQQAVQAIHASLEPAKTQKIPPDLHLVLCSVKDEEQLIRTIIRFSKKRIKLYPFREPDLNNSITAAASDVVYNRRPFRNLKLFKGELP